MSFILNNLTLERLKINIWKLGMVNILKTYIYITRPERTRKVVHNTTTTNSSLGNQEISPLLTKRDIWWKLASTL